MGGLFSRWRTKPSTVEVLESIDKEIQALEEFREKNQRLQKLWVGRLILYSSILYLFTCLIVYLWYLPDELTARLAMTLPFFAFPLIRQRTAAQRNLSPTPASSNQQAPQQVLVSPGPPKDSSAPGGPPERTVTPGLPSNMLQRRLGSPATSVPGMGLHPPGPPLARPILPRERGALDRIVEYLVGDGPQNRYALICQQCFSHNGMALKEEFEYIAFRCAYCFFLNPARKTRPQAPRLPEFSFEKKQAVEDSSSVGLLPSESMLSSENQFSEESLDDQDVLDNSTEQTDDKISPTEQTHQLIEKASGSEELEEKQEETTNEETSGTEVKSAVPTVDSTCDLELGGESSMTK
uniref:Endoplasmic reticulum junction formation protein lunapark n=1 Tax=Cavia porcellus TaxID=10141 RepID=H0VI51_CAVPO